MVHTVIFDIDNTIYSYDDANKKALIHVYDYCQAQFGWAPDLTKEKLNDVQKEIYHSLGSSHAAIHNRLIRFQNLLEREGLPLEPHAMALYDAYWDNFLTYMVPSPGIHEFIAKVKADGVKIGIATDMTAHIQYRKLKQLQLLDKVDFIVTSEEAGVEKPDQKLFLLCVQKAGCKPHECLMIGDNPQKDIEGAKAVGMHALLYEQSANKENDPAEDVIHSFEGLWASV